MVGLPPPPPDALAVRLSASARAVLVFDLVLHLAVMGWGAWRILAGGTESGSAGDRLAESRLAGALALAYGTAALLTAWRSLGGRPRAMRWRRRVGLLAVPVVLWRDNPLGGTWVQVAVVFWTGVVWIALLGVARRREMAAARAEGTAEDALLGDD